MSFDQIHGNDQHYSKCLNPFGTGQCLSTKIRETKYAVIMSQSLWNRAMSFDKMVIERKELDRIVSIPLEQGNVFRR